MRSRPIAPWWPAGRGTRVALGVLLAALLALAVDGMLVWRAHRLNELIAAGTPPPEVPGQVPQVRFAQAWAAAASGADDAALNRYRALQDDPQVGAAARYNAANLLLRQALRLRETAQPGQAIALIELAKESYRDLLRRDPADWNARYNLERAQRLLPDPADDDSTPQGPAPSAERAATTMRGYSPGLP